MIDETRVAWRDWGPDAFAEARRAGKPVLLSLSATWCRACHEMDAETYAEPRIAAHVRDGFVPVRVDVDRQPRVRERYNVGGFPSTVFTTPDGRPLTGTTYLGPDGMRQVLERVRETWGERGADAGRLPRALRDDPTPAGEVTPRIEERLAARLSGSYDPDHAGWGEGAKFPVPRTVEFALKRERDQALATLDRVREHLFDDVEGGFFRYAGSRDWTDVHHEKLLDVNAALVRAFAAGYRYSGADRHRKPAVRTVAYLTDALWNGRAFGASQGPAGGRSYYGLDAEGRAEETAPRRDLTALAGPNALAADALLAVHALTDDATAREYAARTLDFLDAELIDDGVVTRYRDGEAAGERCLLTDHARVVAAFARASQVLGGDHAGTARAAADAALDRLRDGDGAFRDGPAGGPGLLDRPLRPLDGNVEMADALLDLAALTDDARYREAARDAVAAFAGAADRMGVRVAGYGAVAGRLCRDPLVIDVAAEPGSDLHRAALRVADHDSVVRPTADAVEPGHAEVRVGEDSHGATSPEELAASVAAAADRTA